MRRLLITSVGSRVGQEIVTGVRASGEPWHVAGINSEAFAPGVFDCNSAWLSPPVDQVDDYVARLREVVAAEKPDIILPARDDDLPVLSRLREEFAKSGVVVVVGSPDAIEICNDKYRSAKALRDAGLPFVETIASADEIDTLLARSSFPYIAKPRRGFASRGVKVLYTRQEVEQALSVNEDVVVQEYLLPENWDENRHEIAIEGVYEDGAMVLGDEISVNAFLSVEGDVLAQLPTRKNDRTFIRVEVLDAPSIEKAARDIFSFLGDAGSRGPCNLQGVETSAGNVQFFEINARLTGGCARFQAMGFDLLEASWQHFREKVANPDCMIVNKDLAGIRKWDTTVISKKSIAVLREQGVWRR